MHFKAEIYDEFKKPRLSTNNKVSYLGWGLALIIILGVYKGIIPDYSWVKMIIIICLFIPPIVGFFALISKEEHTKRRIGFIEINTEKLVWNGEEIRWHEIEEISITHFDYRGRFIYKGSGDFGNNLSNGLDNPVKIMLSDKRRYEGYVLLASKEKIHELKNVLWEVLKNNSISLENAKRMINPGNYEEHQELKRYCRPSEKKN